MDQSNPRRTVPAVLKIETFLSVQTPNEEQLRKYDEEVNKFLNTIDNTKRLLNGRNAYAVGDRICTEVWYLEVIPQEPVTQPFGKKDDKKDDTKKNEDTTKVAEESADGNKTK